MSGKRARVPESSGSPCAATIELDRRTFVGAALAIFVWPGDLLAVPRLADEEGLLPPETVKALGESPFVYVSPLRSDGKESTCHGEVWYGWLDDGVVLVTSNTSWKARSLEQGLDRARIWVGDFGRWKRPLGENDSFRKGPSFDARVRDVSDVALLERLLTVYEEKYPDGIGKWRDRFRSGVASGERVLLRYEPVAG